MDHQDFVDRHAAGSARPRVDPWRACLVLEQTPDLPLEVGQGYRWQRLWAVASFACALLLLAFVPWWAAAAAAAAAYLFRDWGVILGALVAAAVAAGLGEWRLLAAAVSLALAAAYGRLALKTAKAELVARALADPETYEIALEDRALSLEP